MKVKLNVELWRNELKLCEEIRAGKKDIEALRTLPKYNTVSIWNLYRAISDDRMTQMYSLRAHSRGKLHATKSREYSQVENRHVTTELTMANQQAMIEPLISEFCLEHSVSNSSN